MCVRRPLGIDPSRRELSLTPALASGKAHRKGAGSVRTGVARECGWGFGRTSRREWRAGDASVRLFGAEQIDPALVLRSQDTLYLGDERGLAVGAGAGGIHLGDE